MQSLQIIKIKTFFTLCLMALSSIAGSIANAAPPPINIANVNDAESMQSSNDFFGFMVGINRSSALLGDMWGLRKDLSRSGISLAVEETSEVLGNLTGGSKKGFTYDGLTQIVSQLDSQRAFGHYGGLINLSILNLHGTNLSTQNLQSLQSASGIEGDNSTRLWELWYGQKFLDEDRLDVRIGQQSVDQEFMVSSNDLYFMNTMFGWPMLPSADMPSGGPAYPLSALGVRINLRPVDGLNILAGVFNGDPVKNNNGTDPQTQNRYGLNFPLNGGQLYIVEAQFSYPTLGSMVKPSQTQPLGWTYKIGAWYNTNSFLDMSVDQNGMSLANPMSNQLPLKHKGNYAFYTIADQLLWRNEYDPNQTISTFVRVMGTPLKDRNLVDGSLNVGLLMHSPFHNRPADILGIGLGFTHISSAVAKLEIETKMAESVNTPVHSSENFIELTYQYQVKPWVQVQTDIQYVFNPGAGLSVSDHSSSRIKDELVLGMRTNISF